MAPGQLPLQASPAPSPGLSRPLQSLSLSMNTLPSTCLAIIRVEFKEKIQLSLPPVGVKYRPAAEGGAQIQVNHTLRALDVNSTDPLLSGTMEENLIGGDENLDQAPASISHPCHHRSLLPGAHLFPGTSHPAGRGLAPCRSQGRYVIIHRAQIPVGFLQTCKML